MFEKESARRRRGPILAALAVVVVGILAYGLGRSGRGPAQLVSVGEPPQAPIASLRSGESDPQIPRDLPGTEPLPLEVTAEPLPPEVTAIFEKPLPPPGLSAPTAVEPRATERPPAEIFRPEDPRDAADCLRLEATPTGVDTSRAVSALVEVTVWARNSCNLSFEGSRIGFRVSATSADGFELGSAVGSFSGDLRAFGGARAVVNVLCDPTRVARYSVRLH